MKKEYRVALICANIGKFDPILKVEEQEYKCDIHYFTEATLPFPLPNLNDRLKSKYIKIQTHRFLPNYNAYIWIDGSVEVTNERFVKDIIDGLQGHDIIVSLHPERKNVYQEIEYILDSIEAGKEYLIKRYADQPFEEEETFYKNKGLPQSYPLYVTRFFARWNRSFINDAFNDWWNGCLEFANFDQTMFSYIAWKHGMQINELDYHKTVNEYLKVHKH